jgi:hypothetical protein
MSALSFDVITHQLPRGLRGAEAANTGKPGVRCSLVKDGP